MISFGSIGRDLKVKDDFLGLSINLFGFRLNSVGKPMENHLGIPLDRLVVINFT